MEKFSPQQAKEVYYNYRSLAHFLSKIKKVFTYKEEYNHISGKKLIVTATVPIGFSLHSYSAEREYYLSPTIGYKDEENLSDWVVLNKYRNDKRSFYLEVDKFLQLPDWTEDMQPEVRSEIVGSAKYTVEDKAKEILASWKS